MTKNLLFAYTREMNKTVLMGLSIIVGLLFVALSVIYFVTPANHLPTFIPGFDPTIMTAHYKHGIGSLILGVGAFVFAWFQSGKKSSK